MSGSDLTDRIRIDVRRDPGVHDEERQELVHGLAQRPRRLSSKHFYDERGSELFEEITLLPEYYLTRVERRLLEREAAGLAERTGAEVLVELGAGAATKTRILLDALDAAGSLVRYVPVDVSETMVRRVARELARTHPRMEVWGVVGDFIHHLPELPGGGRRLVALLGSTIGNFDPAESRHFLGDIASRMAAEDHFLLGVDLIKPAAVLEAAYNDRQGTTARFNRNILSVINSHFGADFVPEAFEHRAFFDPGRHRIEMRLVARRPQRVRIGDLGLDLEIEAGEELLTEISTKYDRPKVDALLADAGMERVEWLEEPDGSFALALARRA